jgi:hypothetical protein
MSSAIGNHARLIELLVSREQYGPKQNVPIRANLTQHLPQLQPQRVGGGGAFLVVVEMT